MIVVLRGRRAYCGDDSAREALVSCWVDRREADKVRPIVYNAPDMGVEALVTAVEGVRACIQVSTATLRTMDPSLPLCSFSGTWYLSPGPSAFFEMGMVKVPLRMRFA